MVLKPGGEWMLHEWLLGVEFFAKLLALDAAMARAVAAAD